MKMTRARFSFFASLALHLLLIGSTFFIPEILKQPPTETVEFTISEAPVVKKKSDLEVLKQIVEQDDKQLNDEIPDKAKFLSKHNQVVKKQTVAQNYGDFQNRQDKTGKNGSGGVPKLNLKNLSPKFDIEKMADERRQKEQHFEKEVTEKAGSGAQASQTSDYLKDVEKSSETLLSTREFVYYSFYSRIRRQLNQHWGGKVREKMTKIFKQGRSIASAEDRITKLLITLNKQGTLTKVQVLSDSGVRDLDEAAIEAFKEAAPFPNPPEGIVDEDGTIKIRWDFILEA